MGRAMGDAVSRNPLSWLRDVLLGEGSSSRDVEEPPIDRRPASLFECEGCETTFIGVDKRTCSRCGGTVREIPNEREMASFERNEVSEPPRQRDR